MHSPDDIPAQAAPVWGALKNAFDEGRFPQMLLLDGAAGIGKKLVAMRLASLLCEGSSEPVIWMAPIDGTAEERDAPAKIDAATAELAAKFAQNPFHIGHLTESAIVSVGMVRHLLRNFVAKAAGNRAVIIACADQMNEEAANKLLKTFEEVPPRTYFILTASSRHSLLPTIRSRSACFSIPPACDDEVRKVLGRFGYSPSEDVLEFAAGSPGKAMLAIDSNYGEIRERVAQYAGFALRGDASGAILCAQSLDKSINSASFFLEGLAIYLLRNRQAAEHIHSIHFLLRAMASKKIKSEHAIQNMALRLAQKGI